MEGGEGGLEGGRRCWQGEMAGYMFIESSFTIKLYQMLPCRREAGERGWGERVGEGGRKVGEGGRKVEEGGKGDTQGC